MSDKPTIVVLGFDTTYSKDKDGKPVEIVWCIYAPAHMAHYAQNRERLDFMNPEKMKVRADDENGAKKADFMKYRWAQIEPAYKAWKEGNEIPIEGIPLAAWSGLNKAQADEFRKLGIQSVERIAAMNDSMMDRVRLPGVRDIVAQAKAFLGNSDRSETAGRLTSLEAQNAELSEKLEAAMALIGELRPPEPKRQARRVEQAAA